MRQENSLKKFIRYITLNVLGMIGLSCYILADTFFISRGLGANGLAALNLAIPVYSVIHGCGLMLGMGGATKYSIFKGQKALRHTDRVFSNTVYAAVVLSSLFAAAGFFFSGRIAGFLGADEEIFQMTNTYLKVIMLFAPVFILNDVLNCFVRNDENPRLSMIAMFTGSMVNIVLDYIFIFPMGMGIFGAVLATGFSPVVGMLILSLHWLKKKNHFCFVKTRPDRKLLTSAVALGFPSFVGELASGIVIIVFNMIILQIRGNVGVAAYGVVANISLVVVAVFTGIAQGMQPLLSRSYGRNDRKGIGKIWKYGVWTVLGTAVLVYAGIYFFASPIAMVFNSENNSQLQQIAETGLRIYFTAVPFVGFNIILSMFFASTEKALPAQAVSLLRGLLVIVPAAFLLAKLAGMTGVWLAFPVTECLVTLLGVGLYCRIYPSKNTGIIGS